MAQSVEEALDKLKRSSFRSSFHLSKKDKEYIAQKGMDTIESHAYDFVKQKLERRLENDGRQTPMSGHPVFKAMHATGCCCRGCLAKWYRVDPDRVLSPEDEKKIVHLLMGWIESQK